jgi:DNA-binding PadR family transcriptional regulator
MTAFAITHRRRRCRTGSTPAGWHLMSDTPRRRRRGHRGPGGPGGMRGFLGPGPRAGRGDIRAAILALLGESPMHGYQIMRELSERSGGVWRPSPGSVYPTLQLLQDEGLVSSTESEGRRIFELTGDGRATVEALETPAPWEAVADETESAAVELRDLVLQVMAAARQVVHAGDAGHLAQAKDVLIETRQRLYRILAGDSAASE